jgi:hypothetical protein
MPMLQYLGLIGKERAPRVSMATKTEPLINVQSHDPAILMAMAQSVPATSRSCWLRGEAALNRPISIVTAWSARLTSRFF